MLQHLKLCVYFLNVIHPLSLTDNCTNQYHAMVDVMSAYITSYLTPYGISIWNFLLLINCLLSLESRVCIPLAAQAGLAPQCW